MCKCFDSRISSQPVQQQSVRQSSSSHALQCQRLTSTFAHSARLLNLSSESCSWLCRACRPCYEGACSIVSTVGDVSGHQDMSRGRTAYIAVEELLQYILALRPLATAICGPQRRPVICLPLALHDLEIIQRFPVT